MRPQRTKRPPSAADGTILSGLPAQKKTRIEVSIPITPRTPSRVAIKKAEDVLAKEASSSSEEEQRSTAANTTSSAISSLTDSTLQLYLPKARRSVLSILAGQLPPSGFDDRGRHDGSECVGLQDQWMNLRAAVNGTLQGEGNSALLVGSKGSGKSLVSPVMR